jgi:hypothetical protein
MGKKQMYRADVTIMVDGIWADTGEEADDLINTMLDQLEIVNTDLEWQVIDWKLDPTIEHDTDYSGNLPKDKV